jgi:aconitate hydratase
MGVLPLQFANGESAASLGLDGTETFDVPGLSDAVASGFAGGREVRVRARAQDGSEKTFAATVRIDTPQEVLYYRHGGILPFVLRQLLLGREKVEAPAPVLTAPPPPEPVPAKVEEGSIESFPASDVPSH